MTIFLLVIIAVLTVMLFVYDRGRYCTHLAARDTVTTDKALPSIKKLFPSKEESVALNQEHRQLHAEIESAIASKGATGESAEELLRLLEPHFEKESQYIEPFIKILPALANGHPVKNDQSLEPVSIKLEQNIPGMLDDHKQILAAVNNLQENANRENKKQYVQLAERIMLHMQMEEEILYPAAVIAGRYLVMN